jgi:transcription initiation factor IIE alpha subunit
MMATQQQTGKKSQDKKTEIQEILEKLRQRDSLLFNRIVDSIHSQDDYTSRVLASEVAQIRKAISIIENESVDILNQTKYPELILCPSCCCPEISISQGNTSSKCHCLECGKNWIAGIDNITPKWVENVWSMA